MGIRYDTGALVAAEANRVDIWALHRDGLRHEIRPVVPAAVWRKHGAATRSVGSLVCCVTARSSR